MKERPLWRVECDASLHQPSVRRLRSSADNGKFLHPRTIVNESIESVDDDYLGFSPFSGFHAIAAAGCPTAFTLVARDGILRSDGPGDPSRGRRLESTAKMDTFNMRTKMPPERFLIRDLPRIIIA
jgi:hypothetical protein